MLAVDKHSSSLQKCVNYVRKKFDLIGLWGLYYNFFCRNLISYSVCHCQSLPALSNIWGQGWETTIRVEYRKGLHSVKLLPCQQKETKVEVTDSGKQSILLQYNRNYRRKKVL